MIIRTNQPDKNLHNGRDPYQINQLLENILMGLYMVL
jgi:hypothetical protein